MNEELKKDEINLENEYKKMSDSSKFVQQGFWALGVFFGLFIIWASFVPLDEGVPLVGNVVIDTKRKGVQHQSGGVIKSIYVKEGDFVEEGAELLKLSDSTLKNELSIEKNNIESLKQAIESLYTSQESNDDLIASRKVQRSLILEELNGVKSLVEDGYAPKVKLLELERTLNELDSSILQLESNKKKNSKSILELNFKLEAAFEKIPIIERKINGTLIKANISGQVIDLKQQTIGGVVKPADTIMSIIPIDEKLVIECEVAPNVIDRVSLKDAVDIRFSSFSKSPMLVVQGEIFSVSSDILFDNRKKPHYLARVVLTEEGERKLAGRKMQPGMQAQVIIKTGKRTLLSYILHPLTRRISTSMMEE